MSPAPSPAGPDPFAARVRAALGADLRAAGVDTVQVNVGLRCNLACRHCHVESSPRRTEAMDEPTFRAVLDAADRLRARTLDLTGGEPELHPCFRSFVDAARARGLAVIVRTNLVVLLDPGREDLPEWLAERRVRLIASLPCYLPENVNRQRGSGVHARSLEALRRLNAVGYGVRPDLPLDLVYNPLGPALPPPEAELEAAYRTVLEREAGVRFHRLRALANMPIGRFARDLARQGALADYEARLRTAFNPATLEHLMCRRQVSVRWDGTLYDCDFNLALGLGAGAGRMRVEDLGADFARRRVRTGPHCFGCTAGAGSSCGGALV